MFKYLYALLLLFLIFSCEMHSSKADDFLKIKQLEFNRNCHFDDWNNFRKSKNFKSFKYSYVNSIGKTKSTNLLPILQDLISNAEDDSFRTECIFAISQIKSVQAEQIVLNLPFKSYSLKNQKDILSALSRCASEKTIEFYEDHLAEPTLLSDIMINSAIASRRELNVSKIKVAVTDSASLVKPSLALAYFISQTGDIHDLSKIVQIASNSNRGLAKKYALKKLMDLFDKNKNRFYKILTSDSLLQENLQTLISASLKRSAPWEVQYYAIPLASILKDSILTDRIYALRQSNNIYVSLAALEYLPEANTELAITALLDRFGSESNLYIRGRIIQILAKYYPKRAYSFIMQNLDKGDSKFKSQLLDALAEIKSRKAIRTLKQFINVDDPFLVSYTFENLKMLGYLSRDDINVLLNSDTFYCVAIALEYLKENKKNFESEKIKMLYKKFNKPSNFEVQFAVVDLLKSAANSSMLIPVDTLTYYASHSVVQKRIIHNFPEANVDSKEINNAFQHPAYLTPDSIQYFSDNQIVEINTERGKIKVELFSKAAPYTVYFFLKQISRKFYDGLAFHRVVPDFVIQGGDPTGTGWGGAPYLIPSEHNQLPFKKGSVGIATSGFDTGSSQFFICQSEQPHLNGNYTLFGQIVEGMEVVNSILPGDKILTITSSSNF